MGLWVAANDAVGAADSAAGCDKRCGLAAAVVDVPWWWAARQQHCVGPRRALVARSHP